MKFILIPLIPLLAVTTAFDTPSPTPPPNLDEYSPFAVSCEQVKTEYTDASCCEDPSALVSTQASVTLDNLTVTVDGTAAQEFNEIAVYNRPYILAQEAGFYDDESELVNSEMLPINLLTYAMVLLAKNALADFDDLVVELGFPEPEEATYLGAEWLPYAKHLYRSFTVFEADGPATSFATRQLGFLIGAGWSLIGALIGDGTYASFQLSETDPLREQEYGGVYYSASCSVITSVLTSDPRYASVIEAYENSTLPDVCTPGSGFTLPLNSSELEDIKVQFINALQAGLLVKQYTEPAIEALSFAVFGTQLFAELAPFLGNITEVAGGILLGCAPTLSQLAQASTIPCVVQQLITDESSVQLGTELFGVVSGLNMTEVTEEVLSLVGPVLNIAIPVVFVVLRAVVTVFDAMSLATDSPNVLGTLFEAVPVLLQLFTENFVYQNVSNVSIVQSDIGMYDFQTCIEDECQTSDDLFTSGTNLLGETFADMNAQIFELVSGLVSGLVG